MSATGLGDAWRFQRPARGDLVIDHLGHYVPDADAGAAALARLGFSLPPFSEHLHRLDADAPLIPAGTGNRCVMLERGYLEFLSPTADTPNAREVLAAAGRYVGVHLIAFGTADPDADHARLEARGFSPMPVVDLRRAVDGPAGETTARFGVVRVPEGVMEEGRIQFCEQRAPQAIWQPRWMAHANRARSLDAIIVCNREPAAAARRYARFTGIETERTACGHLLATARGEIHFLASGAVENWFGVTAPCLPWIAGHVLGCSDIDASRAYFAAQGLPVRELGRGRFCVNAPATVGGVIVFQAADAGPLAPTS